LWRALLRWPDDEYWRFAKRYGTDEVDEDHKGSGLEFYKLGDAKWLLEVIVGYGAYNGTFRYYYLDESGTVNRWQEVLFRSLYWTDSGEIQEDLDPEIQGNAWFDYETSRIQTFYKGRGIGDIGSLISYTFADGVTTLDEYRQNLDEQNISEFHEFVPPEEWDLVDIDVTYPKYARNAD
jgi:hypothetical protein